MSAASVHVSNCALYRVEILYYFLLFVAEHIKCGEFTCMIKNKNGHILPTGQWYALSAVINDAWYCIVLHEIALCCIVLHGIAWYCMVLHGIAWYFFLTYI